MTPLQLSNKRSKLLNLSFELSVILASELSGERFHPGYKKNKDSFRLLISSHVKLRRAMKGYFKDLAERLKFKLNWTAYALQTMKFDEYSYIDEFDWEGETVTLTVIFSDNLKPAYSAGIADAHTELGLTTYTSVKETPVQAALRKHALSLAKNLNQTTRDKIKESLKSSIDQGLSTPDAASALADIIDDPYRAELIANTESVQAYSEAKLQVGDEVGAQGKSWQDGQAGACPTCSELDGEIVAIDDSFSDGSDSPPAHPNCRCLLQLEMTLD